MSIASLLEAVRIDYLDDSVAPYLWSDAAITRHINEAVKEACLRAPLITRSYAISLAIDKAVYELDPSVRSIMRIDGLTQHTESEMVHYFGSEWRNRTGVPKFYIRRGNKITLSPVPDAIGTLSVETTNVPDDDFELDDDINPIYHDALLFWVAYKCYMFPDQDTYNPVKARDYLAQFDDAFGVKHSAKYDAVRQNLPKDARLRSHRMV